MKSIKGKYIENIEDKEDSVDPKDIKRWITVQGRKVPILKGESIQEAVERRTNLEKTPIQEKEEKEEKEEKTPEIEELSEHEKAIQKLIEETGYERERAEKEIEKRMGKEEEPKKEELEEKKEELKEEPKKEIEKRESPKEKILKKAKEIKKEPKKGKIEKVKEKTKKELVSKIQQKKKQKQLTSRVQKLQKLNKKTYNFQLFGEILAMILDYISTGNKNTSRLTHSIINFGKSTNIDKERKNQLLSEIKEIRKEVGKMYRKDFLENDIKKVKAKYMGNINGILSDDMTQDFINPNDLSDITLDFSEQEEDFTILHGPITRAGAFEYEKNGHQVIYYKDWENIKEVFGKQGYIPLKASTKRGSHHADILGYATNWKPNDQTEQMFADVVLFRDIHEVTDLLNPEGGYQVSIGFKDRIENNIQWIEYVDHLAMSLLNKDTGRCLTANGKSCFAKQKEMNN